MEANRRKSVKLARSGRERSTLPEALVGAACCRILTNTRLWFVRQRRQAGRTPYASRGSLLSGGFLLEQKFDGGGEGGGQVVKEFAALAFGKAQGSGGGVNKPAHGLMAIAEQTLAQGEGVDRERDAIDQCVPDVGLGILNGGEIALDEPLIAQRTEFLQLALTDAAAGRGKTLQDRLAGPLLIR